MSSHTERRRVKKLLALSSSPNPHEAEVARHEAELLMAKHGWTVADFDEDIVEVADDRCDQLRQRLARAVGLSRRCKDVYNRRGQIGFQGHPSIVGAARDAYQTLIADVMSHCEMAVKPEDPGHDMWVLYYWLGFIDGVIQRLIDDEARAWQPPAPKSTLAGSELVHKPDIPALESQLREAIDHFVTRQDPMFAVMAVEMLRADAYMAGRNRGDSVDLPSMNRAPSPDRALASSSNEETPS